MDDHGIVTRPCRQAPGQPFTRTTYELTHPWYAKALPQKLHIHAGREGLEAVLTACRFTLLPRVDEALRVDATLNLVRALFNDDYVITADVQNHKKNPHPTITVFYDFHWPRYAEEALDAGHVMVYEGLKAFIAALSDATV